MAPMLLLGLVGGMLADVVDRRRMLMGVHAMTFTAALVMTALLWTGLERFWHAYAVILVAGVGWAFDMPARRSLFHDLLGSSGVTNGVALDSLGQSLSMMAGPALAGGLITVLGVKGGYLAVTSFLLTSLILIYRLKLTTPQTRRVRSSGLAPSLADGLRYVAGHQALRGTVLVTLAMNVLMFPYANLIPVIARDILDVGPGLMGILQSAAGLGAAVGAISIASWVNLRYHGRVYLGGALLTCVVLLLFSFSKWYALSLPLLLLLGFGHAGFSTMQSTIVMLLADQNMRGKALGVITIAIGTSPLGAFAIGIMAEQVSAPFAIGTSATAGIVSVVLIGLASSDLWGPIQTRQ
jgi:MFS family permease